MMHSFPKKAGPKEKKHNLDDPKQPKKQHDNRRWHPITWGIYPGRSILAKLDKYYLYPLM